MALFTALTASPKDTPGGRLKEKVMALLVYYGIDPLKRVRMPRILSQEKIREYLVSRRLYRVFPDKDLAQDILEIEFYLALDIFGLDQAREIFQGPGFLHLLGCYRPYVDRAKLAEEEPEETLPSGVSAKSFLMPQDEKERIRRLADLAKKQGWIKKKHKK